MPADIWTEALLMAVCALLVAAIAIPIAVAARMLARRAGEPLVPQVRRWSVPWSVEFFILFPFAAIAPMGLIQPLLLASGFYPAIYGAGVPESSWLPMGPLWSAVVFVPIWIGSLVLMKRTLYPEWKPTGPATVGTISSRIALGVGSWLAIHPLVWIVHFVVTIVFLSIGWNADEHPLAKSFREGRPAIDRILLVIQAAIATPLLEEVLFRGLLLPWILGKKYRAGVTLGIAATLAVALSAENPDGELTLRLGPVLFAAILIAGWVLLHYKLHRKERTIGAVYASAALFAVVHSQVWPTPIPLFVLGLGLGWLAVRTRGILAPTIVHGLFNLVSVLFVLRGN